MTLNYDILTVRADLISIIQANNLVPVNSLTQPEDLPLNIHGVPFFPQIKTSVDNACSVITAQDCSDWTDVLKVDTGVTVTGTVTLVYEDKAGNQTVCGTEQPFDFGFRYVFDAQFGDGKYCVVVEILIQSDSLRDLPRTFQECVELTCCSSKKNRLLNCIRTSIADLSCVITHRRKVGRKVRKATSDLYKLLAYRDYLLSCGCNPDINIIECGYKRIPKHC